MTQINLHEEVDRLRQKLIDLTLNNRLLNYRWTKTRTLDFTAELPDHIFDRLVVGGKAFTFQDHESTPSPAFPAAPAGPIDLPAHHGEASSDQRYSNSHLQTRLELPQLERVLTTMRRETRTAIEETGVNLLYLALGMLEWYESESSENPLFAPLILVPVTFDPLKRPSPALKLKLMHTGDDIASNLSLARRLEKDFALKLPDYDEETTPEAYFELVRAMGWRDSRWRVRRSALLGFFSFHKIQMYFDLGPDNWRDDHAITAHPVVSRLIQGGDVEAGAPRFLPDYAVDEHPTAQAVVLIDNADSSQHSALCDIAEGRSLVIEGPPGTGKSQTITNAIADALHKGRKVLFVAEKLAALSVVQRRLERQGLGELILSLHSEKGSLAEVYQDIARRLDKTYTEPARLEQLRQQLEADKTTLKQYVEAVTQPVGPRRQALHEVFWHAVELRGLGITPLPSLPVDTSMDHHAFHRAINDLNVLARHGEEVGPPQSHPWRGFAPHALVSNQLDEVRRSLDELSARTQAMHEVIAEVVALAPSTDAAWLDVVIQHDHESIIEAMMLPAGVETSWCRHMLSADRRAATADFAHALTRYHNLLAEAARVTLGPPLEALHDAEAILDNTERGPLRFILDATMAQTRSLRTNLEAATDMLDDLAQQVTALESLGLGVARHRSELEQAHARLTLLSDPLVAGEHGITASLFSAHAEATFAQARQQYDTLQQERSQLNTTVAVDALPTRDRLRELSRVLRQHAGSLWRWFSSEYRAAVREVKGFMQPGTGRWSHLWLPPLEQADQYLERVAGFAADRNLSRILGSDFQGMATDWAHLERQLRWTRAMRQQGFGHEQSMSLLSAWTQHDDPPRPETLADLLDRLRHEMEQPLVQQALQLSEPLPSHMPLAELTRTVRVCLDALRQWEQGCRRLRTEPATPIAATHRAAKVIRDAAGLHDKLNDSVQFRHLFGADFAGTEMNPERLRATHAWMEQLAALSLPEAAMQWLTAEDLPNRLASLREGLLALQAEAARVREQRETLRTWGDLDDTFLPLIDASGHVLQSAAMAALISRLADLLPWAAFWRGVRRLDEHGLLPLGLAVTRGEVPSAEAAAVFELTLYEQAGEDAVRASEALSSFSRLGIEQVRERFQRIDEEVFELNRKAVAAHAAQVKPPEGNSKGLVGEFTEMGLIRNEVNKQRRHCKLRELIRRAGAALQAIKPCFLMSPLSVSQFLPPGSIEFDVVIMDEASQIKPEDAIGSVLRGKQLVVVGDPKQLPPTSFFDRMADADDRDDDELTMMDDNESILEVAMKALPSMRRLKWHFRSQHENLIAFSNHYFYDDDLIVFPSPSTSSGKLGVYFEHVPGASFQRGRNPIEAEAVAKAIVDHALRQPGESLGVGAFNAQQRDLIQECLDQLCIQDPVSREAVETMMGGDDPLFVKNLENLQGDERDVIFISYTYGPDAASGQVMQRFGPLTGKNGWRRLNVLVTRARRKVKVFTSMQPEQIVLGENRGRGVGSMRNYLEYARSGLLPDRGQVSRRPPDSDFEIAVARVVESAGYRVVPQVGVAGYFIDLGVYHPDREGEFVLGIECDGATYHSAKSARDRDRIREAVIRSRGWKLHRVWSTDWFLNRAREIDRLLAVLQQASV